MLAIHSRNEGRFCDGLSRRNFLRIGGLGLGGMTLSQLFQAESIASPGRKPGQKAVIMIFLPGGPPHQDMFDLKMDAPSNVRGEFSPISTNVPGIQICEEFPRLAGMMDKMAIVRSIVGASGKHDLQQCLTGRPEQGAPPGGWPSLGAVVSKVRGNADPATPPFIGLSPKCKHDEWGDPGQPGFLGPAHGAFLPFRGGGREDMVLKNISLERLDDRRALLESFDTMRRDLDQSGMMEGMDAFNQQAFGVLTSSKLADALDLSKEDPRTVERYGKGTEKLQLDGCWKRLDQFLMARRLVEAGARVVTLGFSRWDWHDRCFQRGREDFQLLDQGLSALIEDLHQRGLDQDVSVVVWGEFGRSPVINASGGRDHWPRVSQALVAGGGMNTGQIIGATDRLGGEVAERPVHFQEMLCTLYHNLGIDARRTMMHDLTGRPNYVIDSQYAPLPELIG